MGFPQEFIRGLTTPLGRHMELEGPIGSGPRSYVASYQGRCATAVFAKDQVEAEASFRREHGFYSPLFQISIQEVE